LLRCFINFVQLKFKNTNKMSYNSFFNRLVKSTGFISSKSKERLSYYHRKNCFKNVEQIKNFLENIKKLKPDATVVSEEFSLLGIKLGMPPEKAQEILGSSCFKLNNSRNIRKHRIHFYKRTHEDIRAIYILHFFNSKLCYAEGQLTPFGNTIQDDQVEKLLSKTINPTLSANQILKNPLIKNQKNQYSFFEKEDFRFTYKWFSPENLSLQL